MANANFFDQFDSSGATAGGNFFDQFGGGTNAPAPDKYQQAAIDERNKLEAAGVPLPNGYTRRLVHGYTLGADNTLVAAMATPIEMFARGTYDPREAYNYAKAREDLNLDDARKNTGGLGTAAEMLGGAASAAKLAQGGLTFARGLAPDAGLMARSLASAGDAGALGAFSGAMEGNGVQERATNSAKGGAIGLLAGGALPPALAAANGLAAPVLSNIRARINPEGFAQSQVARAVSESGLSPQQIGAEVASANANGTPFIVADAMGNAGQRMLSTVARAPGQGRTDVVNFLENRQAGQGRRIANALSEGFDTPQTAAQAERAMTNARNETANHVYGQIRDDAVPVDLSGALAHIDETLRPGVNQIARPQSGIANDSIENALQNVRDRITDGRSILTDFTAVQRLRGDLSDAVQAAQRSGAGNKARLLGGVLRRVDAAMENASPGFRQANRDYAQASRDIDAIDLGRNAAMRGRTEDTIPAFRAQTAEGQQAFRTGYSDPLIAQAQGAAHGANKARPLLNDAFRDEAAAIAPMRTQNQMAQRIQRENTMFETRNHALGGSRTADNLADEGAMGIDPQLIGHVASGNWGGALKSVLHAGKNALTGNTPEVRAQVARILLQRGVDPNALNRMIGDTVRRIEFIQNLARGLGRGGAGALAVSNASPGNTRR